MRGTTEVRGRRAGFTLVELLVVVAVIALLMGMLLPALSKSRGAARSVVCMSNQRQIGIGVATFRHDHDQVMPWAEFSSWAASGDPYFWICKRYQVYGVLADAVDVARPMGDFESQQLWDVADVFKCPEDLAGKPKPFETPGFVEPVWRTHCSSYDYTTGRRIRWTMNERECPAEDAARAVSRVVAGYSRDMVISDVAVWHGARRVSTEQRVVSGMNALYMDGSVGTYELLPEDQETAIREATGALPEEEDEGAGEEP